MIHDLSQGQRGPACLFLDDSNAVTWPRAYRCLVLELARAPALLTLEQAQCIL